MTEIDTGAAAHDVPEELSDEAVESPVEPALLLTPLDIVETNVQRRGRPVQLTALVRGWVR